MTLKKPRIWVLLAAFAAVPAFAQNIAVVNGTPIPTARANALVSQLVQQGQKDSPQLQAAVREELINREILSQEAARRGIATRPDVKAQLAVAQQTVVLRALIEDFVKNNAPTDAEIKARYDELVKQAGGGKELHLHHILVEDEAQAKDLIAKIKGGASFEDLAKQYSKDPGSGKNGGDLDWSSPQAYVPEFGAAAEKLKKGEVTPEPVKTQFGWHIIRLDDSRDVPPPPLEQVKPQIAQQIQQEKLQAFEEGLKKKAVIK
ncbi:PpiC-type peptidyl-prolyl cis-trans isomerase [Caballeronia arationis]|jgi:peptidyl-prolyl cis-trans isomerase C|uniref:peptidylprolyl isomerase n=1 Tax=Caballeronia arationis TaxID=1777142 RepID=A0A7Z7IAF9_9BURK|nr:peptidylprolyl isomerase [Caballeronia arationis]SAK57884.1 PpiC-type peptidyl-prolyl cis-trans isomerase [Caballeronia arationis]SOE81726.1 Parvulin-like peptidyl-prolyl isomerase [Caballeronia arationis]